MVICFCFNLNVNIPVLSAFRFILFDWSEPLNNERDHDFLNCYMAALQPTLGHYWVDRLTHLMLITVFYIFNLKVSGGSLSLADCLVGFELGTFQFLLKCLNPLGFANFFSYTYLSIGDLFHLQNVAFDYF